MGQSRDVDVVTHTEGSKPGDPVLVRGAGKFSLFELAAGNDLHIAVQSNLFSHMSYGFIRHQEHRCSEPVGKIECFDRQIIHFLNGRRRKCDHAVIPVRAVSALKHIALGGHRRLAGGRPSALNIRDHDRGFSEGGIADIFHHQGKAGSRRRGHRPGAGPGTSDDRGDACNFILHLDEDPADLWQTDRHTLGDFC